MEFIQTATQPSDDDGFAPCDMTWQNRLYAFGACFVLGGFFSIFGSIELWLGEYAIFAFLYTLGTVTALAGTLFLRGPKTQMKKMFDKERMFATIALIASILLTILVVILVPVGKGPLALLCCIVQFIAFCWYTLTYIPGGVTIVKSCFTAVGSRCPCV